MAKSLMILSTGNRLEFTQVINRDEKLSFAKKYRRGKIQAYFFDVPGDEQGALRLGLYQNAQELE